MAKYDSIEIQCMCGWIRRDGLRNIPHALFVLEYHWKACTLSRTQNETKGENMPSFKGSSDGATAPILGAKFWQKGVKIVGKITRRFETVNGYCWQLELEKEISVPGARVYPEQKGNVKGNKFSVGAMKGFVMALQSSGVPCDRRGEPILLPNDKLTIECTGTVDTGKASPLVTFNVQVDRPQTNQDADEVPF